MLFRSEEHVDSWCRVNNMKRGQLLTLKQVWTLSKAWYRNRLNADFEGRSTEEALDIFQQLGLKDAFWGV